MNSLNNSTITDSEIINNYLQLGVEVEKHRIDHRGRLSLTPIPSLDQCQAADHIKREFVVSQTEFVSPHMSNPDQICEFMENAIAAFVRVIPKNETLWPLSMPPILPADHDQIPISKEPLESYQYRLHSKQRHGLGHTINTGVHINLGFSDVAIAQLIQLQPDLNEPQDVYVKLAQHFVLNRWLLTYLFGASPLVEQNYFQDGREFRRPIRSIRSSRYGFGNSVMGDYSSVTAYVDQIQAAVKEGTLLEPREFYDSVRLKHHQSKDPTDLLTGDVTHIELRTCDTNPFTVSGVTAEQLRFIEVLALYFLQLPPIDSKQLPILMKQARKTNHRVALEHPRTKSRQHQVGINLLKRVQLFAQKQHLPAATIEAIQTQLNRFYHPKTTLSAKLTELVREKSLVEFGMERALQIK